MRWLLVFLRKIQKKGISDFSLDKTGENYYNEN